MTTLGDGDDFEVDFVPVASEGSLQKQLDDYSRLIDMKIFDPSECADLTHCTVSSSDLKDEDRYI